MAYYVIVYSAFLSLLSFSALIRWLEVCSINVEALPWSIVYLATIPNLIGLSINQNKLWINWIMTFACGFLDSLTPCLALLSTLLFCYTMWKNKNFTLTSKMFSWKSWFHGIFRVFFFLLWILWESNSIISTLCSAVLLLVQKKVSA